MANQDVFVPAARTAIGSFGRSLKDVPATRLATLAGAVHGAESNEAFAAQACAVSRELGFPSEVTNPNGGAIALGLPIGDWRDPQREGAS